MIGLVVLLALCVAFVAYFVGIYNGLVNLRENVKVAWANIDVLLKQRHDELLEAGGKTCKRWRCNSSRKRSRKSCAPGPR